MKKNIALGGTLVAAALAIALWPASDTDKAHSDGERLGAAVTRYYNAGDELADQVDDQVDAWSLGADLDYLLDDAADFRSQGPEVQRAFWDGFEAGVTS
jgi:hypothetical protein